MNLQDEVELSERFISDSVFEKLSHEDCTQIGNYTTALQNAVLEDVLAKVNAISLARTPCSPEHWEGFKAGVRRTLDEVESILKKEMR